MQIASSVDRFFNCYILVAARKSRQIIRSSFAQKKRVHLVVADIIVAKELFVDVNTESLVVALDRIIAEEGISAREIRRFLERFCR